MNTYNPQYNNAYGGQAYGIAKPQAANSQPLTPDMVNTLRQDANNLNMKIDQLDIMRSMCTHKDPTTGQNTLVQNGDGSYTCSICSETFNFFDGTSEEVNATIDKTIDILQTCKTIYLDAPIGMTEQYYQIIELLKKLKVLWPHAVRNFNKYENISNPMHPISGNYGGFNALNNLLVNPWAMQQQMGYQQPMYGAQPMMQQPMQMPQQQMGYQQPMYGAQPMMQPMVNPGTNPMAYGAPVAPMPGVMPEAQAAPAPAPTANAEVEQRKVFNV